MTIMTYKLSMCVREKATGTEGEIQNALPSLFPLSKSISMIIGQNADPRKNLVQEKPGERSKKIIEECLYGGQQQERGSFVASVPSSSTPRQMLTAAAFFQQLAATFPTPFYLYDEERLRANCRRLLSAFNVTSALRIPYSASLPVNAPSTRCSTSSWSPKLVDHHKGGNSCSSPYFRNFTNYFAVKATPTPAVLKVFFEEGLGVDCSSLAELIVAEAVGFRGDRIFFTSSCTSSAAYRKAYGLGAIINLDAAADIHNLYLSLDGCLPDIICFRYNPSDNERQLAAAVAAAVIKTSSKLSTSTAAALRPDAAAARIPATSQGTRLNLKTRATKREAKSLRAAEDPDFQGQVKILVDSNVSAPLAAGASSEFYFYSGSAAQQPPSIQTSNHGLTRSSTAHREDRNSTITQQSLEKESAAANCSGSACLDVVEEGQDNLRSNATVLGDWRESKFGMTHSQMVAAILQAREMGVKRFAIHSMFLSNALSTREIVVAASCLFLLAKELKENHGVIVELVNLGGGLGVPYLPSQPSLDLQELVQQLRDVCLQIYGNSSTTSMSSSNASTQVSIRSSDNDGNTSLSSSSCCCPAAFGAPFRVVMENGRFLTADAAVLVTRITHQKTTYKSYLGVDACMAHLMRPGLYRAYHHISPIPSCGVKRVPSVTDEGFRCVVERNGNDTSLMQLKQRSGDECLFSPLLEQYDVVGSLCENNDKFAIDRLLPSCVIGDLLLIHDVGAHGHSMGFNYNGTLRSAEYMRRLDGSIELIRRAETYEDYFATVSLDSLPCADALSLLVHDPSQPGETPAEKATTYFEKLFVSSYIIYPFRLLSAICLKLNFEKLVCQCRSLYRKVVSLE